MLGLVTPEEQQGKNPNDGKLQPSAEQMRLFRVLIAVSVKECQLSYDKNSSQVSGPHFSSPHQGNPSGGKVCFKHLHMFATLPCSFPTLEGIINTEDAIMFIYRTLNGGRFTLVSTSQMMTLHHTSDGVT
uniref:Uncharacterized protein n=1 Tax=Magallana gigas TaxID=29159 RepID=A0A8W8KX67_MAGGI